MVYMKSLTISSTNKLNEQENVNNNEKISKFFNPFLIHLIMLCLLVVGQSMVVNGYLTVIIPTIEKQFGYNSFQSSAIKCTYDVMCLMSSIVVGFLGDKKQLFKISIGAFFIGLGSIIFIIPNFLLNQPNLYNHNNNSLKQMSNAILCDNSTNRLNITHLKVSCNSFSYGTLALSCISYAFIGIGSAPLHIYVVTYFDKYVTPQINGIYLGIFTFFSGIGSALGFALVHPILTINSYFYMKKLPTPDYGSEQWIGAWWIGYIVASAIIIVSGVSLLYLSHYKHTHCNLPKNQHNQSNISRKSSIDATSYIVVTSRNTSNNIFVNTLKNLPFLFMALGIFLQWIPLGGLSLFLSKYLKTQFNISEKLAEIFSGILTVLPAIFGSLFGGLIIRFINTKNINMLMIVASITNFTLYFGFLFGCESEFESEFVSKYNNQHFNNKSLNNFCNSNCKCDYNTYEPVCERKSKKLYYSPCWAGCSDKITFSNDTIGFKNCNCTGNKDTIVTLGKCHNGCNQFSYFLPTILLAFFLMHFTQVPLSILTLSTSLEKSKTFAIGMQETIYRFGAIMGPLIYGYILDQSCLLWKSNICKTNHKLSCYEYQNYKMRIWVMITALIFKGLATICFIIMSFV